MNTVNDFFRSSWQSCGFMLLNTANLFKLIMPLLDDKFIIRWITVIHMPRYAMHLDYEFKFQT